jgi:hypothetical protein
MGCDWLNSAFTMGEQLAACYTSTGRLEQARGTLM